jgi:hypothetical protein
MKRREMLRKMLMVAVAAGGMRWARTTVDVQEMTDIEYFQRKLFAALKIPPEYLRGMPENPLAANADFIIKQMREPGVSR